MTFCQPCSWRALDHMHHFCMITDAQVPMLEHFACRKLWLCGACSSTSENLSLFALLLTCG